MIKVRNEYEIKYATIYLEVELQPHIRQARLKPHIQVVELIPSCPKLS